MRKRKGEKKKREREGKEENYLTHVPHLELFFSSSPPQVFPP
jgi:hypothetical protein